MERSEHPQKHFLRQIQGFFAVTKQVGCQAEHEAMMLEDERCVSRVVARDAPLDERSFAAGDLRRPPNSFGRLR